MSNTHNPVELTGNIRVEHPQPEPKQEVLFYYEERVYQDELV